MQEQFQHIQVRYDYGWVHLGGGISGVRISERHEENEKNTSTERRKLMKKVWGVSLGVMFMVSLLAGGCATDQEKPTVERSWVETITATVEALDLANRMVTLRGPQGNVVSLRVDESVKNLPQVKVGDQVVANYYVSLV